MLQLAGDGLSTVEVDCELTADLVACLASNLSCAAAANWTGYGAAGLRRDRVGLSRHRPARADFAIPFSAYAGVFQWTNSWTMPTDFVWRVLNATKPANGTVNLHDAVSPAFAYDEEAGLWRLSDPAGAGVAAAWTES